MNRGGRIIEDMQCLQTLCALHCSDRTTLDALNRMLSDDRSWAKAHDHFDQIVAA